MKLVSDATAIQFRAALATALSAAVIASWRESTPALAAALATQTLVQSCPMSLRKPPRRRPQRLQPDNNRIGA
jgi:hypothetical protein